MSPGSPPFSWRRAGRLRYLVADVPEAPFYRIAFSSRVGGVSRGRFAELNLGYHTGDDAAAVRDNWHRFAAAADFDLDRLVTARQVHGTRVRIIEGGMAGHENGTVGEVDALVAAERWPVLAIQVADCVPVYLIDPAREVVALAHAGWRGTQGRLMERTVEAMSEAFGSRAHDCVAILGPSIGPCCYRVGPEVARAFEEAFPGERLVSDELRLDLWRANAFALVAAGLPESGIRVAGFCTACRTDLFYSHRREGGDTGRLAAVIWREG